jgi:general secretion pathway protein K
MSHLPNKLRQRGAAILTAMLLVTLVASLSAAALWQQWRGIEVETAERARVQSAWVLQGALDWARLILREDGRAGGADHLAEPWAVPLQEARLSTFLGAQDNAGDGAESQPEAFLSGQISDLQARLNITNLIENGQPHPPSLRAFARLFEALRLPEWELTALIQNLQEALASDTAATRSAQNPASSAQYAALVPRTIGQLAWLGLSHASIARLEPYITVLPERTTVNMNTATVLVLFSCIPTLSMANAQRLAAARTQSHYKTLGDAAKVIEVRESPLAEGLQGVSSRYFEVRGQLRLDTRVVQERSLVQRDGLVVKVLWRERVALPLAASLQQLGSHPP